MKYSYIIRDAAGERWCGNDAWEASDNGSAARYSTLAGASAALCHLVAVNGDRCRRYPFWISKWKPKEKTR